MIVDIELNKAHIRDMLKEAEEERVNVLFQRLFRKVKPQTNEEHDIEHSD
jgi:hypothetical protein